MYSVVLMMALGTGSDAAAFGRHGCHGCNGCNGYASAGCNGGGCHRERHRHFRGRRCHGCNGGCYASHGCCGGGGYGCHGGCNGAAYGPPPGGPPRRPPETVPAPKPGKPGTEEAYRPAPATIRVSLPETAKLMVDGTPTTSTSASRLFVSPELPRDKTFYYTLSAKFARDGQELTSTKEVAVRAGEETKVTMEFPLMEIAKK
jgi:uncharacterized protein (TIGR03000 family)